MRLPTGNTLVLGTTNEDLVIDRTDPVAATTAEVVAFLPDWARGDGDEVAPIRDALVAAYQAIANRSWAQLGQVLERFASPRLAGGLWLDAWGELFKRSRTSEETDGDYRARLLGIAEIVSPNAIRESIDLIVRTAMIYRPAFLEPATDAMFATHGDGSVTVWGAFAQPRTKRLWADYPDNRNATVGAYAVSAQLRAEFLIVLPGDGGAGEPVAFAASSDPAWPVDLAHDFGSRIVPPADEYAFAFRAGDSLLDRVISDVESRRAAGVVWMAFHDPLLASAV